MKDFVSAIRPAQPFARPARWYLFREHKLLLLETNGRVVLPETMEGDPEGFSLSHRQFLGYHDDQPCFCGQIEEDPPVLPPMKLASLRSLFGAMRDEFVLMAGHAYQILEWSRSNRHCGRCGSETEDGTTERVKLCPDCGQRAYPRIAPAVIVAVTRGDEILLGRAAHFPNSMYSVLAGFVEAGESLEETIHREIREEVGIEVCDIAYFGSQAWPFPHSLMIGFTAGYAGGELAPDPEELVDAGWFRPDNMPRVSHPISIARHLIDDFVMRHVQRAAGGDARRIRTSQLK